MRNVLLGVAGVVVVAVVGLVGVISTRPAESHVERSLVVAAKPADVWPLIADYHQFITWSPWSEIDPAQKTTFSEPATGVGAWYAWEGNDQVGRGKMTFTAIEPEVKIVEDLDFIEPFENHAVVEMSLAPVEGGTKVTWGYTSPNNFLGKAMTLVMDMDAMLGADFEKGLAKLSTQATANATARVAAEKAAADAAAAAAAAAGPDGAATAAVP